MKRKITFLHLFLLNHFVLTVIVLGVIGAYGAYLVNLEQRSVRERIEPRLSQEAERLKTGFVNLENNVQKLKNVVQMLEFMPMNVRAKSFKDFASETLAPFPMEYNAFFALGPELSKKYFHRNAYVLTVHRNAAIEGSPKYMEAGSFISEEFNTPGYDKDPSIQWWAMNKYSPGLNFSDFYFDKGYMEKVMFTTATGLYKEGQLLGVVGIDTLTSEIAKKLNAFQLGKTGGLIVVDETGHAVLPLLARDIPMLGYRYEKATTHSQFQSMPRLFSKSLAIGDTKMQEFSGADNHTYLTIAKPVSIKGHDWFLVFYQDKTEAYGGLYHRLLILIMSVFGAYLLGSLTLYLTGRYVISREKNDFEELRLSRDSAQAATKAKSAFLSTMSHEIRTPLNSMLGSADLLTETRLSHEQREYVNSLLSAGESLLRVLNDILDFSKIEAGKMILESKEFLLSEIVREAELLVMPSIYRKGLQFHVHYPKMDCLVTGDALRLKQVILNLLGNSVKFTDTGSVDFSIRLTELQNSTKRRLHFEVKDTGVGISKENLERIFDEFGQEDSSVTRRFGGTGLGLSISKKIVELMDGQMKCQSTQFVGSTFSFYIEVPVKMSGLWLARELEYQTIPVQAMQGPQTESTKKKRILLVDDMEENHALLKAYLKSFDNLEIDSAFNGYESIDKYTSGSYDLILMDVQMPKISGLDAIRKIREIEKKDGLARVPIIVVSANNFTEDWEKSMAVGADEHCGKPIRKKTLIDLVTKYCSEEQRNPVTN
ncbi:MAG TPA: ATP-binding protein [Bdellovibrio sp.]|uniref:hybrid sensor histidine kinase/response regulator n=1 Tax=Bdellovibrio sp. TaxID=28201 RepID=UPI002F1B8E23